MHRSHSLSALFAACFLAAAFGVLASISPAAAATEVDWPSYNNDLASDRYVNLSAITAANVGGLHVACSASLGAPLSFESGPIEVGGVIYVTETTRTIALNAATCDRNWVETYAAKLRGNGRGVAFNGGLLFRGFGDGHVVALNATNGSIVWNHAVIAAGSLETINAAPIVWHGMVFIGTASGETGQICHVMALEEKTGAILWSDQNVPNLGTPAAATWPGATRIAGGATWSSFTIDAANNQLYVPVGNPVPDYDVRDREGSNLYTNAILQLNPETGGLRRALQFEPEDSHDWDQAATPAVVTLGNGEHVALSAGKDGWLRAVDLTTYTQTWQTPVTTIANASVPIATTGTHFCPAVGVLWNGPAYSPQTGLAYINAVDQCSTVYLEPTPEPYVPGQNWLGAANVVPDATVTGWLTAVNATTGATQWHYHSAGPLLAGVTATSSGLVFTADTRGNVLVFDAAAGTLLKAVPIGAATAGGVISYELGGKQYVAVATGYTAPQFGLAPATPKLIILSL